MKAQSDVLPFTTPGHAVRTEADVVYARVRGHWSEARVGKPVGTLLRAVRTLRTRPLDLKMDICSPADGIPEGRPLLMMMHGGSFLFGNRKEKGQAAWCRHFASLGYVAASIDYRLGFWPSRRGLLRAEADATADAGRALRYLLQRSDLGIDPRRVFVAGTSAGAIIALNLAYGSQYKNLEVCAVGDFWGYVRDLKILDNARVPILAFQSEQDPVVPFDRGYPLKARLFSKEVYGTRATIDKARRNGIPCELHACPEKHHRLHLDRENRLTPRFYEIRDAMAQFFAEAMDNRA